MAKSIQIDPAKMARQSREVSELLKCLAHKTRLLAVCFIGQGERSVQELEEFTGSSQSNLSQHLGKLRGAGILATRRDANIIYYRVDNPRVLEIVKSLQNIFC